MRTPDFNNVLKVLRHEKPDRATLFEIFLNDPFYEKLAGCPRPGNAVENPVAYHSWVAKAVAAAGYDYVTFRSAGCGFSFPRNERAHLATKSQNGEALIEDWESYEKYNWPQIANCNFDMLDDIGKNLPEGMKMMAMGPGGVLENAVDIVGYDNLCYMLYEEPELVETIFEQIGSRILAYYENVLQSDSIGMLCSNDDWGFNTQTFLSPADMRRYVFPWHKKIVEAAHRCGKPVVLHSCGYFGDIIEDVIEDMKFDGRHSYEDGIMPVEEAYETYGERIAIVGGIDMNLMTAGKPEEIYKRACAMLERTADRGGYLLGSGNSIPYYVPFENFQALTRAALEFAY